MRRSTAVYLALAAADTYLAATGRDKERRATKPLLMPTLRVGKDPATKRALALGGAGDVALLGDSGVAFTAGLGSFLAGHVAWMTALRRREGSGFLRRRPAAAVPYVAAFAGLNAYLWPRTGKDRLPVLVYSTALLGTALVALDTGKARTAAGGALFLVSDTLLALEKFGDLHLPLHEGLVMATYTGAQGLLATE
ncbi:MAG TPA: lysoplasmalogenase [Mycobacteriales bacterium]|nr:lysoplasmalogenase [Mycobacteriales bacterium]